jgi:hypothetical protein
MTLEEIMTELHKLGEVMVWTHDSGGWTAQVKLNTKKTGADFKISSDYRMKTCYDATKQCLERITSD